MSKFVKFGRSTPIIASLVVAGVVVDNLAVAGLIPSDPEDHIVPYVMLGTTSTSATSVSVHQVVNDAITGDEMLVPKLYVYEIGVIAKK